MLTVCVIDADLRLIDQVRANVFEYVLGCDISSEGHLIDSNRWPVECAIFLPGFRVVFED